MARRLSAIAPDWWDYTTLDPDIIDGCGAADATRSPEAVAAGLPGRVLRHARGLLSRRGARIRRRVAAEHRRPPGRHLRADRSDRAAAAGGAASSTRSTSTFAAAISGAWTSGSTSRPAARSTVTHPLSFERADRELCFSRIRRGLRMPDAHLHFPKADTAAYREVVGRRRALRGDAGRPGRREALGVQRSAAAQGPSQGRAAAAGRVPQARHARRRSAPADHRPERPHQRRRQHLAGADEGDQRRPGRDVEGREGLDLARRPPRQPVRPAADRADDLEAHRRHVSADVAAGGSSERAVQLLQGRDGERATWRCIEIRFAVSRALHRDNVPYGSTGGHAGSPDDAWWPEPHGNHPVAGRRVRIADQVVFRPTRRCGTTAISARTIHRIAADCASASANRSIRAKVRTAIIPPIRTTGPTVFRSSDGRIGSDERQLRSIRTSGPSGARHRARSPVSACIIASRQPIK